MKIIFSVFQSNKDIHYNLRNHKAILSRIDRIKPTQVRGMYKGITESSIMIESDNDNDFHKHWSLAVQIAELYNQESILVVDDNNIASLYYPEADKTEVIGVFRKTDVKTAYKRDSFSKIDGNYYIVA